MKKENKKIKKQLQVRKAKEKKKLKQNLTIFLI